MEIICPGCGICLEGSDDLIGRKVECTNCGVKWVVACKEHAEQRSSKLQWLSKLLKKYDGRSGKAIALIVGCVIAVLLCVDIGVRLVTQSKDAELLDLNSTGDDGVTDCKDGVRGADAVIPEWDEIVAWLREKAAAGDVDAQFVVGTVILEGHYRDKQKDSGEVLIIRHEDANRKKMEEAIKWYLMASRNDDLAAINAMGVCYYSMAVNAGRYFAQKVGTYGRDIDFICFRKNSARKAMDCFNLAIGAQYPDALYNLCTLYGYGHRDYLEETWRHTLMSQNSRRLILLGMAAEEGHVESLLSLARGFEEGGVDYEKDQAAADKYYEKAKTLGLAYARGNYGIFEWTTTFGYSDTLWLATKDAEAIKQTRNKAEAGDASAQYAIGECYYEGRNLKKDPVEAVGWYRMAADRGLPVAQYALGVCYYDGVGLERDVNEAFKWFLKSARQGNEKAKKYLGICYYAGLGVERNEREAIKWLRESMSGEDCYFAKRAICWGL